ncbi:MAG: hypothetical protein CMH62_00360 [Nanoarchaeota archaeon]|nr:hypothetical protein [Nanoarchaeota archaeon]|tara:strand:+ start:396 stop:833 length:438 start_codon:yes stop_codon:yes gene_type:complete
MPKEEVRHSDRLDFVSNLKMKNNLLVIVLILVSILLLMGLDETAYTVKNQEIREVTIFAEKWEFVPSEVKVKANERVRLKLVTSEENQTFGFKLSRFMYNEVALIEPNKTTYVDVFPTQPGTFTYRCESPCGFGKNLMVGKFIIE